MDSVTGLREAGLVQLRLSLLSESIDHGTNKAVLHQLTRIRESCIVLLGDEGSKPSNWQNMHSTQEVFIGPKVIHAFVKLQSCVATLITSVYLGDTLRKLHAMHSIEHYLSEIAKEYDTKIKFN